jgi:hypothetical protein
MMLPAGWSILMNNRRAKTDEEIDDIIDKWHDGEINTDMLHDALGWTWEEYARWLIEGLIPVGPKPDP